MAETTEVAIIGGGAAGCAVAYYLAQSGVRSTIIEREGLGNQASGNAAGGLNPLTGIGIPGPLAAFGWECFELHADLYPSLKDQTGIDYQLRTVAKIDLAMEESEIDGLKESKQILETKLAVLAKSAADQGALADVLSEELLSRTFRRHLLAVGDGQTLRIVHDEHLDGSRE